MFFRFKSHLYCEVTVSVSVHKTKVVSRNLKKYQTLLLHQLTTALMLVGSFQ